MTYANVFYFKKISKIGGTEQFLYEIAKKYKDWDITVFFDEADRYQLRRLKKYVRCKQRVRGEKITCKKAFFNFNIDAIDDIESTENYYAFVSHANYEEIGYKPPIEHPKLNHFIGVSQFATDKLNEYGEKLGLNIKAIKCYDPLTLEEKQKVPIIVSACRLDDKVKGGERTLKLIDALDKYCEKNNRQYLWLIFTNKTNVRIDSPNAIYMQPRIDVRPYIAMADWVAQLSNDMETYCYTTNEANGYGIPIITTPLSVYKELPVTDNERLVLDWDCSNVDEIARLIFEKEIKPFKYTPPKDDWDKILADVKSSYKEERKMNVKVRCIRDYYDLELNKLVQAKPEDENYERIISRERADVLEDLDLIKVLEIVKPIKEKATKPRKNTETTKKEPKKEQAIK